MKPHRGRQRKYWCKVVDHLFSSLGLDKAEWLEDIRKLKSFLGVAGEGIDERESGKFEEGLNSKVKFSLYRTFGKMGIFVVLVLLGQDYCLNSGQERMDLMKSWAGIEEEKAGRSVCCVMQSVRVLVMCCGVVLHRSAFMLELRRELGDRFEHFQSLDSFEKSSYVLGSEAWEEYLTLGAHAQRGLR